jgi:hypothetical protein
MQDAIAYIQESPGVGNRDVMIGEYGIPNDLTDTTAATDLIGVANGAIAMGVGAFYRAIYNTGLASFGLVGPDFCALSDLVCLTGFAGRQSKCRHGRDLPLSSQNDGLGPQAPPANSEKGVFRVHP